MNQRIGTCSLCGGAVTIYSGAWGGSAPPQATCGSCGATPAKSPQYGGYGGSYPILNMQPSTYKVRIGGGGSLGGGGGLGHVREWVSLTDAELIDVANSAPFETMVKADDYIYVLARAIELALKEKNT